MPAASRGLQFHPHQELLSANFPLPWVQGTVLCVSVAGSPFLCQEWCLAILWVWGWQQSPAACRDNQDVSPHCLVLLLPFGLCRGIS